MKNPVPLKLERSETAVLHAASRIYAAYVAGQCPSEDEEKRLCEKAINTALQMAREIDIRVKSDDELG